MLHELRVEDDDVVVTVEDGNPTPPRVNEATEDSEGGRRTSIVDTVARDWGWKPTSNGKSVWGRL